MGKSTIYSTGYGNKNIDDFINELKSFEIKFLLDIRSKPYSKWNVPFNQESLDLKLRTHGINYVFVGDSLGGLPEDRGCYDFEGKVIYDKIKEKDFFKEGLKRLIVANSKKVNIAIMCSESKPEECHRSKLIGQELLKHDISINHIVPSGITKSQELVMNELNKGKAIVDLFGEEIDFTSRKTY
ncbi:DUF488 family protein [Flagellimonas olearia]|uniref:DUF488 family protein n=1 Tax=Flagellimonas olearia TaxID=552546 RepID=A0A444VLS1_9FLAO|nr:DUF488 domain-containing protein [Allomuricauda olearia]RYC51755.1 hypothetical protein DN53_13080 [Allomuricauda olearia]